MKKVLSILFTLVGACFAVLILFSSPTTAQILFEDNFSRAAVSEKKWAFLQGKWSVKGGALKQDAQDAKTIAVISDDFWDDTWNEYVFEVTAKKFRGKNGVRIFWRINDDMQPAPGRDDPDQLLLDSPIKGRLGEAKSRIKFWWEIGWENKESFVVTDVRGVAPRKKGTETKHKMGNDPVQIKIVNQGNLMTLFFNGEMVFDGKDLNGNKKGRVGVGTLGATAEFDNVFVSGLKGRSVEPGDKLTTSWGLLKTR